MSKKIVPIVMGSDTLGYSYAREFYKHYGVKSLLLSSVNARYVSLSKFLDCEIVPGIDKEDVLVDWLKKNAPRFKDAAPIVFSGTGDWRIRTLSKHKEELTALGYYIPAIDFPLLDKISQKDIFYSYCAKLGVPFPKTRAWCFNGYKLEEELAGLTQIDSFEELRTLEYPLIAKPSNSADWHFANIPDQHKIYTIKDADQLVRIIKDLQASPYAHALLLQEMLATDDESLHTITTFSDAEGNMLVGVTGDVILQSHTKTGIGNPLVILGRRKYTKILDSAAKLLKEWKYEGFANFDVMDGVDGEPRFLEINTRPGRNTYYFSLAGCPFVKPMVEYYINGDTKLACLTEEERRADKPFLFSMVGRDIALSYAHGENLAAATRHFDEGTWQNPLLCKEDSFLQKIFAKKYVKSTESNNI